MKSSRKRAFGVGAFVWGLFVASRALAAPEIGKMAPDFSAQGADGRMHSLKDSRGKITVLEWFNKDCPYVKKYYSSHAMQKLQAEYGKKGVVWHLVFSSAKGKQGYADAAQAMRDVAERGAAPKEILLDAEGKLGKLYGAKTTPHLFVIDPKGVLVYQGAIDDRPTSDVADLEGAKNYVRAAIDATLAGKPVATASTKPYGCSVKY